MSYLDEAAQDMAESFKRIFITAFGHGYDFGCESKEGELKRLRADNAKLRELVEGMHAALQAFCDAQDVHGDNCPLWVERTDDCELRGIERRMRELEVDACPNCGAKVVEPTTNDVDAEVDS